MPVIKDKSNHDNIIKRRNENTLLGKYTYTSSFVKNTKVLNVHHKNTKDALNIQKAINEMNLKL